MKAPKKQIAKFKKSARELGCDDDERAFEDKLQRLAKAKPKPKRDGPLKIPLKFDDAIKRALEVAPPPEGRAKYEAKLKRRRQGRRQKSAA